MKITVGSTKAGNLSTDVLVAAVYGKGGRRSAVFRAVNAAIGGGLGSLLELTGWSGKAGEVVAIPAPKGLRARLLVVGSLGDRGAGSTAALHRLMNSAAIAARPAKASRVAVHLDSAMDPRAGLDAAMATAIGTGWSFGRYAFDAHLAKKAEIAPLEELFLYFEGRKDRPVLASALERGFVIGAAQARARNLVNEPANIINPVSIAEYCKDLAEQSGLEITVLGQEECEARNMGAYLAVSRGTRFPPQFIHMVHKPAGATRRVALVGKALTFDSGGLCLKPAAGQATMKMDMGGSAAVIGTMAAVAALDLPIEVHGICAATENMTGEDAYRTGDVLTASNGKTIEVLNTDAEGRLTLADALHYAAALEPEAIVDLATLTGACLVALGPDIAAVMGTGRGLMRDLRSAADTTGEPLWELPMPAHYRELLSSKVADMSNLGGRWGGAITAGLFLKEFVPEGIPWAHLDIAGPCFVDKPLSGQQYGATGFGVRLLTEWLSELSRS